MTTRVALTRPRGLDRTQVAQLLLRGTALIALAVMLIVFGLLSPSFLQFTNLEILAKQTAINAILAIGMTFVILTGGIDLSVGSVVGITAMIAGLLINEGLAAGPLGVIVYPHTWMVVVLALLAGAAVGALNGLIITRFRVAPFIATLGMLYVARGGAGLLNDGNTFPNLVGRPELGNTGFAALGAGDLFGISYAIWIMALLAVVAWFVTTRTPFGRAVYAVGGNERSAALSGIRVDRTKLAVYTISGVCAAIVGLIIASQLVAAHPRTGEFFELNAIAAVVLGGTSLSGGRGAIVGTLIGAFVIGVLTVGLNQLGVSSFWQLIVKGSVIVLALILDQLQERVQRRIALQQQARTETTPGPAVDASAS
jgi:erythritol transport system permease protein